MTEFRDRQTIGLPADFFPSLLKVTAFFLVAFFAAIIAHGYMLEYMSRELRVADPQFDRIISTKNAEDMCGVYSEKSNDTGAATIRTYFQSGHGIVLEDPNNLLPYSESDQIQKARVCNMGIHYLAPVMDAIAFPVVRLFDKTV